MRWPNRRPHVLTEGMHKAQAALARFVPLIDWTHSRRRNWNAEIEISSGDVSAAACGDEEQAVMWLVRTDTIGADGRLRRDVEPIAPAVRLPEMRAGRYRVTAWDTLRGSATGDLDVECTGRLTIPVPPFIADTALAIRRVG